MIEVELVGGTAYERYMALHSLTDDDKHRSHTNGKAAATDERQ